VSITFIQQQKGNKPSASFPHPRKTNKQMKKKNKQPKYQKQAVVQTEKQKREVIIDIFLFIIM